ncbi:UvrD-helicase domain-containing protein [Frateuria defendens]|uniref:UvrD-helicase domain-containing protein n=1 Tax=Frateuria defendens TaxID=2219559 RepID=UPI00066FF32B|nr:UvrD-helicase domain-containing protein [Frateuria defendens]
MTTPREAADWRALDLAPGGRSLIEASAGTGKTWTIAALYLRLLLEQGLSPRQIVVTTFTDAAAQELRERLRARLAGAEAQALAWVENLVPPGEDGADAAWLLARWQADAAQAARDRVRLRLAQAELDLAPVATLHGLCRRILADYPFESGSGFQGGELVSADDLLDEWAQDLWRRLQQGEEPAPAATPASLAALRAQLKTYLQPGVALWAPGEDELLERLPERWAAPLEALAADKAVWGRKRNAPKAVQALAAYLRTRTDAPAGKALDELAEAAALLAAHGAHEAAAFVRQAVRLLGYVAEAAHIRAWQGWLAQVHAWREQRLRERGQLSFDELIVRVREAVGRADGVLAARLAEAWPVALVDEFQDTDAQQYAILDAIYRDAAGVPRGRLVMIGDPKQAIYRFRGGDIDAYLDAAASADERLQLAVNHRSSRAMVAALNQFYALAGTALSAREPAPIHYVPVAASRRRDGEPYTIDGEAVTQPLALHALPLEDCPPAVPERVRAALEACANQIAGLLAAGTHRLGGEPLQPGDIAVLLPGNADVAQLRALLQHRRVPCVGAGRGSVFELEVARELQMLLHGIEHAGDEGAVRAALATRLYGVGYAELAALREQPEAWLVYEQQFHGWRQRWQREGVLAVVRALTEHAAPALLAGADGERTLTDLRHLGELLQEAEDELHGAAQLLAWFARQREGGSGGEAAEERQLRIESDARRVRLMTLHASKGLEFPIVFLPLMWDHTRSGLDTTPVIREPLAGRRVIGFGPLAAAQYGAEGQDERFRVLYVALTRAIHACHVYVLPPGRPARAGGKSALGDPERAPLDVAVARLLAAGAGPVAAPALAWAEGWPWPETDGRPDVRRPPPRRAQPLPPARPLAQVYSFSLLTRSAQASALEDQAASDEEGSALPPGEALEALAPAEPAPPHPALAALSSVRGADIGNALHAMFEKRTIGAPMHAQRAHIDHCLREFGVAVEPAARESLIDLLAERLQANLDAPLLPGFALGALPAARQLAEMEFHYLLDDASLRGLRAACARLGEPELVPLTPVASLRGRMTGKIDLIVEHEGRYLVLDYKSNWLGDSLDAYRPEALPAAMDAHHYRFQALLYTVALERMLRQRLPGYRRERHLGESLYLFVRAVGLAPGAGIWRHRFDDALIEAVDRVLAGREGAAA